MDIIKGRRKQLLINKKTLNFVILLLLGRDCIIWKSAYFMWYGFGVVFVFFFFFKGWFFSWANAGHPVPKVSGVEFFQSRLFSAKTASVKISASDGTAQRPKAREGKRISPTLNVWDAGLKTCHFAQVHCNIKLPLSHSPRGVVESY